MYSNLLYKLSNVLNIKTAGQPQKNLFSFLSDLLIETSFKNIVYASGGFVRDAVKGIESNDLDLVVQKDGGSKQLCAFILNLFDGNVIYEKLNINYPTYNLKFKDNLILGNKKYNILGADVDISDTAKMRFSEDSGRKNLFIYGNLKQDALQRDFTINSLFQNIFTKQIIDPTGYGTNDIKNNLLRLIPNTNHDHILNQNAKVMLRYCRFFAKYKMNIVTSDVQLMKKYSYRVIESVTEDAIKKQIAKIPKDNFKYAILMMKRINLYPYIKKYLY